MTTQGSGWPVVIGLIVLGLLLAAPSFAQSPQPSSVTARAGATPERGSCVEPTDSVPGDINAVAAVTIRASTTPHGDENALNATYTLASGGPLPPP